MAAHEAEKCRDAIFIEGQGDVCSININNCIVIVFSYLMVADAIDWNICPEVLGMTKGQMFQSIAPETIK
jgi:hypothetical protein